MLTSQNISTAVKENELVNYDTRMFVHFIPICGRSRDCFISFGENISEIAPISEIVSISNTQFNRTIVWKFLCDI